MADSGKEVLDRDSKIADFCAYLDILRRHRQDFAVSDVSFVAIPDKSGDDYNRAYQRGADIQLKAIRDDSQKLSDGATAGQAQLDLIRQTDKLQDVWDNSEAANAAWDDYQHNSSRLERDLGTLRESSAAVKGVADNIEQALTLKQQQTTSVVKSLIEGTLRNSPGDFENRLVTGAASIWARNQGGGIGGLGTNQHLYAHHGAPGDNWNWNDVKADLQNSVADAFAAACKQLDAINVATDKHLQENYAKLLEALNIPQGPAGTGSGGKLSDEEKAEVARWSQFGKPGDGGVGDCSRWAIASALANKYGTREGPDGKEINLPPEIQDKLMGGKALHFPPTKDEINVISSRQSSEVAPSEGFQGDPNLMSKQLTDFGLPSTAHTAQGKEQVPALVDQMTADLQAGRSAIVNGAPEPGGGHFLSVTGITTGPNGETLYLVNDSNRVSTGSPNSGTLPNPCTRAQLEQFLINRASAGAPGYSTI